jgi:hypothetical protein
VFAPITGGLLDIAPRALDLEPGATSGLVLQNLGPKPARFSLQSSDPRVHVAPHEGELGPWPAKTTVTVSADVSAVDRGTAVSARVTVEMPGAPSAGVEVLARAPLPVNLAREATATASSIWSPEYEAAKANDGYPDTRWNSREGDKDGSWIELAWKKPVRFDRVVIDEYMDDGPRIQTWKLQAGDIELKEIAAGNDIGTRRVLDLPKPVKASRLRLRIGKASIVPSIWEIEVNLIKRPVGATPEDRAGRDDQRCPPGHHAVAEP